MKLVSSHSLQYIIQFGPLLRVHWLMQLPVTVNWWMALNYLFLVPVYTWLWRERKRERERETLFTGFFSSPNPLSLSLSSKGTLRSVEGPIFDALKQPPPVQLVADVFYHSCHVWWMTFFQFEPRDSLSSSMLHIFLSVSLSLSPFSSSPSFFFLSATSG